MPQEITDLLVVGSGGAGLTTAWFAAQQGAQVTLIANFEPQLSNTHHAQGGIIFKGKNDHPQLLKQDIQQAGGNASFPPAVSFLAHQGPRLVKHFLLDELKVPFDRGPDGALDLTEEGAHSLPRIIHHADATGRAIAERLLEAVTNHPRITIITPATAVDLLTLSHHSLTPQDVYEPPTCVGAFVLLPEEGRVVPFFARETVLATGGLGQIFLHTTNPRSARGDGIAMAARAGVRLINLEYIQFHPTALYHPEAERFLISETVRGEGGVLLRRNGHSFMENFHPQASLAPRDVVARAIHQTMMEFDEPYVYLDISHKPADWVKARFPQIYEQCLRYGIDITQHPIPVVPAAHYSCGGIAVDRVGRTSMRRLRAVGEVSCTGVHGANRLASTSLLEAIVWGHSTALHVAHSLHSHSSYFPQINEWQYEHEEVDPALVLQDWLSIKYTMWNYAGLIRTTKRLLRAKQILRELEEEIESFYARSLLTDELLGLRNGIRTALAVLYACLENRVSRGCHYRAD